MTDTTNKIQLSSAETTTLSSFTDDSDDLKRLKIEASCQDETGTGNENSVLSSPNTSRSPEECVFLIDHILESILEKCDRQTLLNFRLVSRRWAHFGSKELQKTVSIIFHQSLSARGKLRTLQFRTNQVRSLKDLSTVMNNSAEFPCTSFDFRGEIQGRAGQSFFDAHGIAIKKIKFQDLCIDDLKTFLLRQAPNLQQLYLSEIVRVEETNCTQRSADSETGEQQSDQERRQEHLFGETASTPKPVLKNLKKFRCRFSLEVPEILIQQILECSPNLVDVALPGEYIHLLVRPTDRVHIVKKLIIELNSSNIESYELFASHLEDNENFAVREIYYRRAENDGDDGDEEFSSRVANVMRKILRASSTTCQKLVWGQEVDNLQIPRMSQVKHLTIQYYLDGDETDEDDDEDEETIVPINSLGGCLSLGDTFPNLKSLELRTRTEMGIRPIANIFNDVDPLPAANVKVVTMRLYRPRQKVVQSFKDMFPNAFFRKKVPADSDDDGDSDQGSGSDEPDNDEEMDDQENYREKSDGDEDSDEEYDEWALKPPRSLRGLFKMGKY